MEFTAGINDPSIPSPGNLAAKFILLKDSSASFGRIKKCSNPAYPFKRVISA
jgi:hypothetical protein